ncbi:hypothetical protein M0R45_035867 [Rubus argutus]|uniref:Uncharacterized protein n=1 Tax=Rubus argutus TaxID=59490 RepID=A0AAW1VY93_RUBAR
MNPARITNQSVAIIELKSPPHLPRRRPQAITITATQEPTQPDAAQFLSQSAAIVDSPAHGDAICPALPSLSCPARVDPKLQATSAGEPKAPPSANCPASNPGRINLLPPAHHDAMLSLPPHHCCSSIHNAVI